MANDKKKTTIAFDADNWVKLQNVAAMQNSSPTQILNELVDSYVNDKLPENYEQRIQEKVFEALDKQIEKSQLEAIADKVYKLLQAQDRGLSFAEDVPTIPVEGIAVSELNKDKKDTSNTTSTTKPDLENTTNTTSTSKLTAKEKVKQNLARFKQYRGIDNRKSYDDGYVAASEGLSKTAINRYRLGKRRPKQDFVDRWGLSWNGERWVNNVKAV